jgi:hypothetical protein
MKEVVTAEQMGAAWFAARLAEAGFGDVEVQAVAQTQIGTGQIGKCIRFDLALTGDDRAPTSFVGKFASDDPVSRATGVALRNYYREVEFYQHLASRLSISVPRCYYAAIADEGPEFVLLLEDMTPAEQGDQLQGCTVEVAREAVLELVGLQVPSWCDSSLEQFDWLVSPRDESASPSALYQQILPGFLDRYGSALEADEREIISRVAESPGCPLFQPAGTPFCLEHENYRLDNMLIDPGSRPPKITVVDWQSLRLGKPMNDVAYFLGAGLLPEVRRGAEQGIVQDYHRKLQAAGVTDYEWDRCWTDYRCGSFSGFGVTVIASMIVQQTERGDEMFIAMARRHARHALDLEADEFLD